MKASGVSLLPHDFIVFSLISAFSTSLSLPSRKNHRVQIFLNDTGGKTRNVFEVFAALMKKYDFAISFFLVSENMAQPEFLEGIKEPKPRSQSLGWFR